VLKQRLEIRPICFNHCHKLSAACWLLTEVLEQVKLLQLQTVSNSRNFLSALIPLPPLPDDSKVEHFDWTQLWHGGVTVNLPFTGSVGKQINTFTLLPFFLYFALLFTSYLFSSFRIGPFHFQTRGCKN